MNNVSDVFIRDHQSLLVVMMSILFQRRFLVQFDQMETTYKLGLLLSDELHCLSGFGHSLIIGPLLFLLYTYI